MWDDSNIPMQEPQDSNTLSFCSEVLSLLLMAYLFIIFCFYPLYMQNGYNEIGSSKFFFYRDITIGALCVTIPLAIVCLLLKYRQTRNSFSFKSILSQFSITDGAAILYAVAVIISYLMSDYREDALWGAKGWHMGLVTQILFVLSYFLISRFWEYRGNILFAFMAGASAVFFLGLLNRFSIFPLVVAEPNSSFLSTIGNINWYCGYFSVLFPIGFTIYWFTENNWIRLICGLYVILGTATGVSQGSASAFIVFAGLYIVLFCLSFKNINKMKRFFELCLLFCLTCQGLRIWRIADPDAFDYYTGTLSEMITISKVTLYAMIPIVIIYISLLLRIHKKNLNLQRYKIIRQIFLLVFAVIIGVYIMLLVANSVVDGGIRFMGDWELLKFSKNWGSARGGTWKAGYQMFVSMDGTRKLIGIGPDCFEFYLYKMPAIAKPVIKQFGDLVLRNAHNEWLTVLVNNGLLGLLGYAGIFISAIIRFIYKAQKYTIPFLYVFGICIFTYTIHNIVSFQQILSTPFIFLMLGMGESLSKAERKVTAN